MSNSISHEFGSTAGEIASLRHPGLDDVDVLEKVIATEFQNGKLPDREFVTGVIDGIAEAVRSRK
jgi:hypothetical protein